MHHTTPQPTYPPGPFERSADALQPHYATLPAEHQAEMRAYVEDGKRPGPLMEAVCSGDLWAAFNVSGVVPEAPSAQLLNLIGWVAGQMPVKSFGNVSTVEAWVATGGLNGRARHVRRQIEEADAYKAAQRQNSRAFAAVMNLISGGRA